MMRRAPFFTFAAVMLLALGIGGNAALFTMIDTVLVKPVAGINADGLFSVTRTFGGFGRQSNGSYPDFLDFRTQMKTASHLAAFFSRYFSITEANSTERVRGAFATANFLETLGVRMELGRSFRSEEEKPGAEAVVVLGHELWTNRFAADSKIVGRKTLINGQPFTIIGVAAKGFRGPYLVPGSEFWIGIGQQASLSKGSDLLSSRDSSWVLTVGRLKPGVSLAQANAEIEGIAAQLRAAYPETHNRPRRERGARAIAWNPVGTDASEIGQFMAVFAAVGGLALLVVCANVANLLLSRASIRRREVAIRRAVGASSGRLIRQMMTEGLLLAVLAVPVAILIAMWGGEALARLIPKDDEMPLNLVFTVDGRVMLFALAVALLSTIIFSLAPAFESIKSTVLPGLKAAEAGVVAGRSWLRKGLVLAQVALCVVLLIGAALLSRSLTLLQTADPRMDARALLLAAVDPGTNGYTDARVRQIYADLEDRMAEMAGVRAGALAFMVPFTGGGFSMGGIRGGAEKEFFHSDMNLIGPSYFDALAIPLMQGRPFTAADGESAPKVVIINERLAKRMFPDGNALGHLIETQPDPKDKKSPQYIVAGIARDSVYRDHEHAHEGTMMYLPWRQHKLQRMTMHLRAETDPLALVPLVREAARQVDASMPLFGVRTMQMQIEESFSPARLAERIIVAFGAMAVLIAAIGLYAVMSFMVAQRTREIGIRMALGATRESVLRASLKSGLQLAGIGLLIGVGLSLAMSQALAFILYGVKPADPVAFGGASLLLAMISLAACYLPARRAAAVDPMVALRYE